MTSFLSLHFLTRSIYRTSNKTNPKEILISRISEVTSKMAFFFFNSHAHAAENTTNIKSPENHPRTRIPLNTQHWMCKPPGMGPNKPEKFSQCNQSSEQAKQKRQT